jgi:hypothetical protein
MSERWTGWGLVFAMSVGMTIGLYHLGWNLGGALAGGVVFFLHVLGAPLML